MLRGIFTTVLVLSLATMATAGERRTARVNMIACNDAEPFGKIGTLLADGDESAVFVAMLSYVVAGTCIIINKGDEYFKIQEKEKMWQVRKSGDPREFWTGNESMWIEMSKE